MTRLVRFDNVAFDMDDVKAIWQDGRITFKSEAMGGRSLDELGGFLNPKVMADILNWIDARQDEQASSGASVGQDAAVPVSQSVKGEGSNGD